LNKELEDEREIVFCIAKTKFNTQNELDNKISTKIFKFLKGQNEDCPVIGPHWESIGFQGSEISNDLRGAGMFAMLQALYFVERYPIYSKEMYNYSKIEIFAFPFMALLVNFSFICLQSLKKGYLIPSCNKRGSIIDTMNNLFITIVDYFYVKYTVYKFTIHNMNSILQDIEKAIRKNINKLLDRLYDIDKAFPPVKDSMTLENKTEYTF
jgi:hypothetical protein